MLHECVRSRACCSLNTTGTISIREIVPYTLSGPATRRILEREFEIYKRTEYPAIELLAIFGLKPDFLASCEKTVNRFQTLHF